MKKFLFHLVLVGVLVLALSATATAQLPAPASAETTAAGDGPGLFGAAWLRPADVSTPTLTAIDPATAANDLDIPVTITGTGFATDLTGTILPTATLGTAPLTGVAFVNDTTLTATVPWGIDPGTYDLTVTNPDGGTVTLPAAFTVTAGIGRWNGAELYGGDVRQILMKPGDPDTLYAPAYGLVGLFRSADAGETWKYTGGGLSLNNGLLAVDSQHPDSLWAYAPEGVTRSTDQGDTWTTVMPNFWPDGRQIVHGAVYPSPSDPAVVFVSSYYEPLENGAADGPKGLIRSADGGATWTIVNDLDGVSVVDVAFDPSNTTQMTLVTQDARVYHSNDAGSTWSQVASPPVSAIGFTQELAYNPFVSGEVWILSSVPDGVFKSTSAALDDWLDVTPDYSPSIGIAFTGADSVHLTHWFSTNGGTDWEHVNPVSANGSIVFDAGDAQVGYVGDGTHAVQKTTDGGLTWQVKNHGLAGMVCRTMSVSRADPRQVFAAFGNWAGVYRSQDGAGTWSFHPVPPTGQVGVVRVDPGDPGSIYSASDHICRSTDGGEIWADLGWNTVPPAPPGMVFDMEPDPFQPGHLLASLATGDYLSGPGYLYTSSDFGVSWQPVAMPQALTRIQDIAFDPATPGLVFLTSNSGGGMVPGTGVYRSTDGGATWMRVDPVDQPDMRNAATIAIATHPQHVVLVNTQGGDYRSTDDGATWQKAQGWSGGDCMFADDDSTRLYAGAWNGLYFSGDFGDSWTRASGAFGHLQITALGWAKAGDQVVIYAATNGGQAGTSSSAPVGASRRAAAVADEMIGAGIYRFVVVTPALTLKLSGLREGALRLGHRVTIKGLVTPTSLAGSKVTLTVQRRRDGRWRNVKVVTRTIGAAGAYSWTYQPAKSGAYRVRATMTKNATHTAAVSTWRGLRVR